MADFRKLTIPGLFALGLLMPTPAPAAGAIRVYAPEVIVVQIDGLSVPAVKADLVDTQTASGTTTDTTLTAGFTGKTPLTTWLADTFAGHGGKKNLVIAENVSNGASQTNETVASVGIKEVGLPAFDAMSKNPGLWTVKFTTGASTKAAGGPAQVATKVREHVVSDFALAISGIDGSHVSKIDPITVQVGQPAGLAAAPAPAAPVGPRAVAPSRLSIAGATVTVSSLVIHAPTNSLTTTNCSAWLSGGHAPKTAAISLLTPDLKTKLGTVNMTNVVITKITSETISGQVPFSKIEMTVGSIGLTTN